MIREALALAEPRSKQALGSHQRHNQTYIQWLTDLTQPKRLSEHDRTACLIKLHLLAKICVKDTRVC